VAKSSTRDRINSAVVRLLRTHRMKVGMSMNRLAEASGLSPAMISFVERELRKPTLDTLLRIAEALNVKLWVVLQEAMDAAGKA
jgi:transcriptional regulator with XRE-family HTH domain